MITKQLIDGLDCWIKVEPLDNEENIIAPKQYIAYFSFTDPATSNMTGIINTAGQPAKFDTTELAFNAAKNVAKASLF